MTTEAQSRNWNDLPDIQDVAPFNYSDEACLDEIKMVLEKYKSTSRFGVALLHQHFPIGNDEVLVERNDPTNRRLTIECVKASEVHKLNLMTTVWRFEDGVKYGCSYCNRDHHRG